MSAISRARRWPWLLLVAVMLVGLGSVVVDRLRSRPGPPDPLPAEVKPWFGPKTHAEALAAADLAIAGGRERLGIAPHEWLRMEMLARALVTRYRLSGSYADLAEADALLDKAMASIPSPGGPSLSRAEVSVQVHRLEAAEAGLTRFAAQAAEPEAEEAAAVWNLRGDIAFQRGQMNAARTDYAKAQDLDNNAAVALRQANLELHGGNAELARRRVNAVLRAPKLSRAVKAQVALQRAAIAYATGDWKAAGVWVRFADAFFPGHWLAQAHLAQQQALEGDVNGAIARYTAIAERTGLPEVMDALAHLLRLQGRGAESRRWADKAGPLWAERMRLLPEAAALHVAEHELALGDPARALVIAKADAARRPHGAALVLLARAQLLTGDAKAALATLDQAQATGWHTAQIWAERADVLDALGQEGEAEDAREEAIALNPRAADPAAQYIWFGHD